MFKKLVKAFSSKDKEVERTITSASELLVGDIVTFKSRSELPVFLQGADAEVTAIGCYEYRDEAEVEFTMKTTKGDVFFLSPVDYDGEVYLSLSKKVTYADVTEIFDENNFSDIFDEEIFAKNLCLQKQPEGDFDGWLDDGYSQTVKAKQGFFHAKSKTPTGRGQEFLSHFCEAEDDRYGLQVEIWEDGETDVFLTCECTAVVVQDFWPASQ